MLRSRLGLELGEIASGREGGHHGGGLVLSRRRAVRVSIRGPGSRLPGFVDHTMSSVVYDKKHVFPLMFLDKAEGFSIQLAMGILRRNKELLR